MSKIPNDVKRIQGHKLDVFMPTYYEGENRKGERVSYELAREIAGYSQSECIDKFLKQIPRKEALKIGNTLAFGDLYSEDKEFSIERSFSALKRIDRLVYDNYEELIDVAAWFDFLKEYFDKIPFSMFLDDFCIHIKNVKMNEVLKGRQQPPVDIPKHLYIHIKRNNKYKNQDVFYFTFHYYSDKLKHYWSPIIFEINISNINLLNIFSDNSVNESPALSIDLRKTIEDNTNAILIREERGDCFVMSLEDVNYIDHYAKSHGTKSEYIPNYVATISIEQTVQSFYALCIIYKATVEMVLEKERKEEYNKLRKESEELTDDSSERRVYKSTHTTKNLDDHKVINLNKNLNMCVSHKSYKRVKTHFRRKCNYQYTVVGHYRHYKNGKTVYIKPYNKNTEKPFRGKEYRV